MNTWHCITVACRNRAPRLVAWYNWTWPPDFWPVWAQVSALSRRCSHVISCTPTKCFRLSLAGRIPNVSTCWLELQDSLESHIFSPDATLTHDIMEGLLVQPEPNPRRSLFTDSSVSRPAAPFCRPLLLLSSCKSEPASAWPRTCISLDCNTRHFECSTSSLETQTPQTRRQLQQVQRRNDRYRAREIYSHYLSEFTGTLPLPIHCK